MKNMMPIIVNQGIFGLNQNALIKSVNFAASVQQGQRSKCSEDDMLHKMEEHLEGIIRGLQGDIELFGPAGDDLARLAKYKKELEDLRTRDRDTVNEG